MRSERPLSCTARAQRPRTRVRTSGPVSPPFVGTPIANWYCVATPSRSMLTRFLAPSVLLLALGAGCIADSEDLGKSQYALAEAGAWHIPPETLAIGDTMYVEYTGAGPWVGSSGCSGSMTPGAVTLREWLSASFPQISSIGGYSCRAIVGSASTMSVHGTGRALDLMIPTVGGDADNDLGDPIGNWLIEHAEEIGIQYIIWDRWTWGAHRAAGDKSRSYGGTHPHNDHLHVELSVEASREGTPWFTGPMEPPDATGCEALGADGGVIDDSSACFSAFGPATYWRAVAGTGHGGSLLWTNAFSNGTPSNWARWHVDLTEAGDYAVEVFVDPAWGVFDATRYAVRHGGAESSFLVDQSAASGWTRLGVLTFAAGAGQDVNVYDNTGGTVASDQHIAADAVRLVRVRPEPPADPGTGTDPGGGGDPGTGDGGDVPDPSVTPVETPPDELVPPMEGDPSLDDDPMLIGATPGHAALYGGCSVARPGGATPGLAWAWMALFALVLPRLRTRRSRGASR